jgi:hypothetical protein
MPENHAAPLIPEPMQQLLYRAPLLIGESKAEYEGLLKQTIAAIDPANAFEWMWVKEFTDVTWELNRLRHIKAGHIQNAMKRAVVEALEETKVKREGNGSRRTKRIMTDTTNYFSPDEERRGPVEQRLERAGVGPAGLMAEAHLKVLPLLNAVQQMEATTEQRRRALVRDLDLYRALTTKGKSVIDAIEA